MKITPIRKAKRVLYPALSACVAAAALVACEQQDEGPAPQGAPLPPSSGKAETSGADQGIQQLRGAVRAPAPATED